MHAEQLREHLRSVTFEHYAELAALSPSLQRVAAHRLVPCTDAAKTLPDMRR
jgi:hypothetical protein